MDEQTNPETSSVINKVPAAPKTGGRKLLLTVLILALLVAGAGAYWWRDRQAKDDAKKKDADIAQLQHQVSDLTKQLADEKAKNNTSTDNSNGPSQEVIDNVKASINSGNTAALEGYMASKVNVIIAASEGLGERSPTQAVADITSYISDATGPWDFALPAATLSGWASGDYAQYFPSGAVVGQSSGKDKMAISFVFNSSGKITTVFMAANTDLL